MTIFQAVLSACAILLTVVTLVAKFGWVAGTGSGDLKRLEAEVAKLREWRHKVGDDPNHAVMALYTLHGERIGRLEQRVFNGNGSR